jgi:hypothetical protein
MQELNNDIISPEFVFADSNFFREKEKNQYCDQVRSERISAFQRSSGTANRLIRGPPYFFITHFRSLHNTTHVRLKIY